MLAFFPLFLSGDITQKGYEKKRAKLIGAYLPQPPGKNLPYPKPLPQNHIIIFIVMLGRQLQQLQSVLPYHTFPVLPV